MSSTPVSIGIVTWNSAATVERCLAAVRAQTHVPIELVVVDNASTDATRAILERTTEPYELVLLDRNVGFSAAQNRAIAGTHGLYYLALNPDVFLTPAFVGELACVLDADARLGAATGKLVRDDDRRRIDSTGIYMIPSQRHLDRGADEIDEGQYDRPALVFGVSGAAGFFRRAMLDDIAVDGEYFDEDFFAYREDADLAWRAQMRGWRARYVPSAVAAHVRRVTPERRATLPAEFNRMSVRNRFLLRVKNQPATHFLRYALPTLWRDAQVVGYTLLREHESLPAFAELWRLLPRMLRKRRSIMRRRRVALAELSIWWRRRELDPNDSLG